MSEILKSIVEISYEALKEEDAQIKSAMRGKTTIYSNCANGILHFNNEHFFQYAIAKRLALRLNEMIKTEVKHHDIVIGSNDSSSSAVIEIKRWMSGTGNPELPKIDIDIQKLRESSLGKDKILLILSVNPIGDTKTNSIHLIDQLNLHDNHSHICIFTTTNKLGETVEFWVLGIVV